MLELEEFIALFAEASEETLKTIDEILKEARPRPESQE